MNQNISFWHFVGAGIFIFILCCLLPSWVVILVAGVPLAMGLSGLLNRWFGADANATRWIVIITAVAFVSSIGWSYGERQYPWLFENFKINSTWRSFQATQAIDPQQPLGLHKSVYDTRRDRIVHKQKAWAEVLQNLRTGANPSSAYLEGMLQKAELLNNISKAAKEKIAAGTLCAEDVIEEAEDQRPLLQQQLEKIRLTPLANTAADRSWWGSIATGSFPTRLLALGLIVLLVGLLARRKNKSELLGWVTILGGVAIIWSLMLIFTPEIAPTPASIDGIQVSAPGQRQIRIQPGGKYFTVPARDKISTGLFVKSGYFQIFNPSEDVYLLIAGGREKLVSKGTIETRKVTTPGTIDLRGKNKTATVQVVIIPG
jgi:hypothetical protein